MKFTINQESFSNILQKHLPVLPARTTLPILNSIRWEFSENKIEMHSTDLEITLVTETVVETEGEGAVAVPAKKLAEIIRELPAEPVLVILESNHRVKIQGAAGVYQIAGSDAAMVRLNSREFLPRTDGDTLYGPNHAFSPVM